MGHPKSYSAPVITLKVSIEWAPPLWGSDGVDLHPGIDNFLVMTCHDGHSVLGDKATTTLPLQSMPPSSAPGTPA